MSTWQTEYIAQIQQRFISQYDFPENPEMPGVPLQGVPDGEYPMEIDGKMDRVRITNGFISCCNFEETVPSE